MNNVEYLLTTQAIREQAARIYELTKHGEGQFDLHLEQLDAAVDLVIHTINEKYPSWDIPYHSRWGHFKVGGKDRLQSLLTAMKNLPVAEIARSLFDLVIVSVLLDAGAGAEWKYRDQDGDVYSRSEGLAVASFEMFMQGKFSSDASQPFRVDSNALMAMTPEKIAEAFQVSDSNPLSGLAGRADLMVRLGKTVAEGSAFAVQNNTHRPGYLYDYLQTKVHNKKIAAKEILDAVLHALGPIWPGRTTMDGINLGDCWQHTRAGLIPFHKLSQWLSYSLLEPIEMTGVAVINLDELTPLAEYRNGGLLIDTGLITPKDANAFTTRWQPDSKLIIEWRALTIILIELIAERIRQKKNLNAETLPLAKVLEGGTWWTGRKLANEKRNGKPPIEIVSDGTVF